MDDFIYYNPVKLFCGESKRDEVIKQLKEYGNRVLLILGGESFVKNGHYQPFANALDQAGLIRYEMKGNRKPSLKAVREGIKLCRKEHIDVVLGIGGGACMDIAKTIAFGVSQPADIWEYLTYAQTPDTKEVLPVGTIPTFPSSGSDMNGSTQITNEETGEQAGLSEVYPRFAWLNPAYVMSLPVPAMVEGQLTAFVQVSMAYLGLERSELAESAALLLMNTIRTNLKKLVQNPNDQEVRTNLMLSSALNVSGLTFMGKNGDWSMYPIQSILQNYCGVGYKHAITVLFPYWVKHIYQGQQVVKDYFQNAFGIDTAERRDEKILEDGINALFALYRSFDFPTYLNEVAYRDENLAELREMIALVGEQPSIYTTFTVEKIEAMLLEAIRGNVPQN